jgi:hypothetical protein
MSATFYNNVSKNSFSTANSQDTEEVKALKSNKKTTNKRKGQEVRHLNDKNRPKKSQAESLP